MENKDAVKFYNKTWFMWVTLIFVAPVGIFLMWKNKRYDKPARIALSLVFALIFIIAVAPKEDNKQVTSTTKVENATKQEVVEDKKEPVKTKEEIQKEENEKKAEAAAALKKKQDFIKKNTKQLSAGEYNVSTHLDSGAYDITFNGSGNLFVNSSDGGLLTNIIGGGDDLGVTRYRAILPEGCKIKISGMSINTKPAERKLMSYSNNSLYSGYWVVGTDVTSGRYTVSPIKGSGNFFVYSKGGSPKVNEILGSDIGVKEAVINLDDGDIINISGIESVKFSPTN